MKSSKLSWPKNSAPANCCGGCETIDQPGLSIRSVCRLPEGFGKAQLLRSDYVITVIDSADPQTIRQAIDRLMSQSTVSINRKNKAMTVQVADQIASLGASRCELHLSLAASESATLRPSDVLDLLGFGDWIENGSLITRVRVALQRELDERNDPDVMVFAEETEKTNLNRRTDQITSDAPVFNPAGSLPRQVQEHYHRRRPCWEHLDFSSIKPA